VPAVTIVTMCVGQITIAVVDDRAVAAEAMREALDAEEGLRVIGVANTVEAAVRLIHELNPDVVVSDVAMPDGGIVSLMAQLGAFSGTVVAVSADPARSEPIVAGLGLELIAKHEPRQRLIDAVTRTSPRVTSCCHS
jgi:DNA-binding NarL/FixJ family response regulator